MHRTFVQLSLILAAVAGLFAGCALLGYALGAEFPITLAPGLKAMSPLTALAIALLAGAVACVAARRDAGGRRCANAAGALGLAGVASHAVFGVDILSGPVVHALSAGQPVVSGAMSLATALAVLLLATALSGRRVRPVLADRCAAAAAVVAGTAVLGYAYGVGDLYRLPMFNTMAANTAASLFSLAVATLLVAPEAGAAAVLAASVASEQGFTRRLAGFVAAVPVVGWGLLRALDTSRVGVGAAMALLVVVTIVPLSWLILRDGRQRLALDAERLRRIDFQAGLSARLEASLAQKVAELEHETSERTKVEAAMYRAQRMEAVGRLTGGIAHDFNNLLQALSGNVTLLQRRLPEADPNRRFADNAAKAVAKGAKLTGQLMAFSRSQRLSIKPVFARAAIQDACELARHSLGPDVVLDVEMPGDDLWVSGDAQQLELALVNLMINARDAMPAGGRVRLFARPTGAPPGVDAEPGFVGLFVQDDGEGMPPEVVSRAGEPFFTTKAQGKGSGLGLAQVFGFARQCGGDVRIRSVQGTGTTVEIILPAGWPETAGGEAVAPPRDRGTLPASTEPILVIDDDPGVRDVIAQALRDAGFAVQEAADGMAALQLLAARRPALAIIDFMMPLMNGAEVARRAQALWPGLPIVFVSGYADTLLMDGIAGATVLRKPFDLRGLKQAVDEALAASPRR